MQIGEWIRTAFGDDLPQLLEFVRALVMDDRFGRLVWIKADPVDVPLVRGVLRELAKPFGVLHLEGRELQVGNALPHHSEHLLAIMEQATLDADLCRRMLRGDEVQICDKMRWRELPDSMELDAEGNPLHMVGVKAANVVIVSNTYPDDIIDLAFDGLVTTIECTARADVNWYFTLIADVLRNMALSAPYASMEQVLCSRCGHSVAKVTAIPVPDQHAYHCMSCAGALCDRDEELKEVLFEGEGGMAA